MAAKNNKKQERKHKRSHWFCQKTFNPNTKTLTKENRTIQKNVDCRKLKTRCGNNPTYDFNDYKTFKELFRDLCYKKMTIDDAKIKQDKFDSILAVLSNYTPNLHKYFVAKNKLFNNAKNIYEGREKITGSCKNEIFLLKSDDELEEQQTSKKSKKKRTSNKINKNLCEWIEWAQY